MPSAAPETGNTAAIVGGVTSGVLIFTLIVAVTIIAVVALLKLHCDLPVRTPVQYVNIVLISCIVSVLSHHHHQSVFLLAGSLSVQWVCHRAPMRPMSW